MKRKHLNIVSVMIIMLALVGSVFYVASDLWKKDNKSQITRSAPVMEIVIPPSHVLKEIHGFTGDMKNLILIPEKKEPPTNLSLFGFQDTSTSLYSDGDGTSDLDTEYLFSLAFTSGRKKICIIDDVFHTEGSTLPDGFQILKIESSRVLLKKHEVEKWIFPVNQVSLSQNSTTIKKHAFQDVKKKQMSYHE